MNLKKEALDQSLHFVAGAVGTFFLSPFIGLPAAVVAVAAYAVIREVMQRLAAGHKWYDCKWGCRLDLSFWALGILTTTLIKVLILN